MSHVLKGLRTPQVSLIWVLICLGRCQSFSMALGLTCGIDRGAGLEGKRGKRRATERSRKTLILSKFSYNFIKKKSCNLRLSTVSLRECLPLLLRVTELVLEVKGSLLKNMMGLLLAVSIDNC